MRNSVKNEILQLIIFELYHKNNSNYINIFKKTIYLLYLLLKNLYLIYLIFLSFYKLFDNVVSIFNILLMFSIFKEIYKT